MYGDLSAKFVYEFRCYMSVNIRQDIGFTTTSHVKDEGLFSPK